MYEARRGFLKRAGGVALAVALAGCSNGDGSGGGGDAPATGTDTTDETQTKTPTGTERPATGEPKTATPTPGPSAATTDVPGTVADGSNPDLAFVWHRHYEMNGVQGVEGLLENRGGATYEPVTVTAVPKGDGGARLGEFSEEVAEELPPGERTAFRFRFDDVDGVARYAISSSGTKSG